MLRSLLQAKKRGVFRSFIAGLLSHYAAVAALITLLWLLRPFLWAAIHGTPYQPDAGPVDPSSSEGTLLQVIGLLSWVPGGFAAAHWSPHRNLRCLVPIFVYMACLSVLGVLGGDVPVMSPLRAMWYWLTAPLGAVIGVLLYQRMAGRETTTLNAARSEA